MQHRVRCCAVSGDQESHAVVIAEVGLPPGQITAPRRPGRLSPRSFSPIALGGAVEHASHFGLPRGGLGFQVTGAMPSIFVVLDLAVGLYLVQYSGGFERRRSELVLLVGVLLSSSRRLSC